MPIYLINYKLIKKFNNINYGNIIFAFKLFYNIGLFKKKYAFLITILFTGLKLIIIYFNKFSKYIILLNSYL